jgi:hypothetical protein
MAALHDSTTLQETPADYLSALVGRIRSKLKEAQHLCITRAAQSPSDVLGDCCGYADELLAALSEAKPNPVPPPPVPVEDSGVHIGWPRWIRYQEPYDEGARTLGEIGEMAKARITVFPRSLIQVPAVLRRRTR